MKRKYSVCCPGVEFVSIFVQVENFIFHGFVFIDAATFVYVNIFVRNSEVGYRAQLFLCSDPGVKICEVGYRVHPFYAVIQGLRFVKWVTGHNLFVL